MNILQASFTSIKLHGFRDRNRPHHVKSKVELSVTLAVEIIMHRAYRAIAIGITHLVGHILKHFLCIMSSKQFCRDYFR